MTDKKDLMVRVPAELHDALKREAAAAGRSVNSEVCLRLQLTIEENWQVEEVITKRVRWKDDGEART